MKAGVVLLLLGVVGLILGASEFKSREEVFRVGDFRATTTHEKHIPAIRYAGGGFIVVGAILLGVEFGKSRRR